MTRHGLSLGLACLWNRPDPQPTWSYTPWNLREQLSRLSTVHDIGPKLSGFAEMKLKIKHAHYRNGRVESDWYQSGDALRAFERDVQSSTQRFNVDAILQMSDYAAVNSRPYFLYQDLSRRLVLDRYGSGAPLPGEFNGMSIRFLSEGMKRQEDIYARSAKVFCMSSWLGNSLISAGMDPRQVKVVPPGVNSVIHNASFRDFRPVEDRHRLIIVGTELIRKGLKDVLDALPAVRDCVPRVTLTVIGPARWPLPGQVPPNVRFLGRLNRGDVATELIGSDLLVMPSQWEGFGMVFAEALLAGIPCIGRNDCAMPEIIDPPRYGTVVGEAGSTVNVVDLAGAIVASLHDDDLYKRVRADHEILAEKYSWQTAAETMVAEILNSLATK